MKRISRICIVALALLATSAPAQVGYVNVAFKPGDNLFVNPLTTGNNLLSQILIPPDGTTISLWNPASLSFDVTSTYSASAWAWSMDLHLPPGTGARLTTSTAWTGTFVGEVLAHDGDPALSEPWPFAPPAPFSGPNGIYLLEDKCPMVSTGNDVHLYVLGRTPNLGEQFTRLDRTTQTYITSTYGAGGWDILPSLGVAEAAFFNIGPIPEPSMGALLAIPVGLLGLRYLRNRSHKG